MAMGTWEDFTSKYGFCDGATVERRDFTARLRLVGMLNDHHAMKAAGLHALAYDRPGFHNPCLVVVVRSQAKTATELMKLWQAGKIRETPLPDEVEREIVDFVAKAYETSIRRRSK
jgi:hypothetical protein